MTTEEAKFILSAYRPGGADAGDAAFCEAMGMAEADPVLGAWFARLRAHDAAVAAKIRDVAPPAGLREAILAGVRVTDEGRGGRAWWGWAAGLAAAAALAAGYFSMRVPARPDSSASAYGDFAINDMLTERHGGSGEPSQRLISTLEARDSHMPAADQIDFEKLRDTGCRTITFAGHDVLEVCFARNGAVFHLYMVRRDGPIEDTVGKGPSFVTAASGFAAVWSDRRYDYALASTAGVEAIRRLLF